MTYSAMQKIFNFYTGIITYQSHDPCLLLWAPSSSLLFFCPFTFILVCIFFHLFSELILSIDILSLPYLCQLKYLCALIDSCASYSHNNILYQSTYSMLVFSVNSIKLLIIKSGCVGIELQLRLLLSVIECSKYQVFC